MTEPFAVWITGLPASGKSTLAAALKGELAKRGVQAAVLESDELRRLLTPKPRYDEEGRDAFYGTLLQLGLLLLRQGVSVIFDATANRRRYRDRARELIPRYFEVHVDTPLDECRARDPKGLYRAAPASLPGLQAPYEPPLRPEFTSRDPAGRIADAIMEETSPAASCS